MNPLQLFLLQHCQADPNGTVPLKTFMEAYFESLDGSEDEHWRNMPHVLSVLARRFPVGRGIANRRVVVGLSLTREDWSLIEGLEFAEVA